MFIPLPNILYDHLWLRLSALSSDGSAPAAQYLPEGTTAKLLLSNQQLPAYLTRTAPEGKVPLPEISSPVHSGEEIGPEKVVCESKITQGK